MTTKDKETMVDRGLVIFAICATILVIYILYNRNKKQQSIQTINTINAILDTGTIKHNPDSSTTYTQQVIENLDVKSLLAIKDKKIADLQEQVKLGNKKYNELLSVTLFDANTNAHVSSPTIVHDTIKGQPPVYESQFYLGLDTSTKSHWIEGSTVATWDTTLIDLKIHNSFSLTLGRGKDGIAYGDVINRNPYSETKSVRIYNVNLPQQSKWGWQATGGYGLMFAADGKLYHGVSITIGFGRRLFK